MEDENFEKDDDYFKTLADVEAKLRSKTDHHGYRSKMCKQIFPCHYCVTSK